MSASSCVCSSSRLNCYLVASLTFFHLWLSLTFLCSPLLPTIWVPCTSSAVYGLGLYGESDLVVFLSRRMLSPTSFLWGLTVALPSLYILPSLLLPVPVPRLQDVLSPLGRIRPVLWQVHSEAPAKEEICWACSRCLVRSGLHHFQVLL